MSAVDRDLKSTRRSGEKRYAHQVGEHDAVLERTRNPYQIQWILVHRDLGRKCTGIITTQERAPVRVHTDAEIADPDFQYGLADDVCYRCGDARIDLGRVESRRVWEVVEGYEENIGYAWRGGGATGE